MEQSDEGSEMVVLESLILGCCTVGRVVEDSPLTLRRVNALPDVANIAGFSAILGCIIAIGETEVLTTGVDGEIEVLTMGVAGEGGDREEYSVPASGLMEFVVRLFEASGLWLLWGLCLAAGLCTRSGNGVRSKFSLFKMTRS